MTTQARQIHAVDPGFLPTLRQMALAVEDQLDAYYTPYWPGARSGGLVRLPGIGRHLVRRTLPPELARKARAVLTSTELTRVALGRIGVHKAGYSLLWRRNEGVDRKVAKLLPAGATVLAENGGALAVFTRARETGGVTILDYPFARFAFGHELLREEAELRPEWADTIAAQLLRPAQFERLERELDLADSIVVASRFVADSFRGRIEAQRLNVIPYGVDTRAFHPCTTERKPGPLRVLFVGHVSQRKGVAYLLDAMRLLDPERFELTLVGGSWGSRGDLASYDGLYRQISGTRPTEMPALYRKFDVLVLPSLLEGSAISVLEAMASGLPVVVTPNTGADAVRDGIDGFVIPIRRPEAIADRLEKLERDAGLRERLGSSARTRARASTWTRFRASFRAHMDALHVPAPQVKESAHL